MVVATAAVVIVIAARRWEHSMRDRLSAQPCVHPSHRHTAPKNQSLTPYNLHSAPSSH